MTNWNEKVNFTWSEDDLIWDKFTPGDDQEAMEKTIPHSFIEIYE
jgi:hypothetical protein